MVAEPAGSGKRQHHPGPGQHGRSRQHGVRLPTPAAMALVPGRVLPEASPSAASSFGHFARSTA